VTTGLAGPGETERPARAIFFGSGAFAVPILDALARSPHIELVGVVSAPDRPVGRKGVLTPVPVTARARDLGLPLIQPERVRAPEAIEAIAALDPGTGVLADYGQIVPPVLLELPRHGILNVHPSLLPRHRGASPIPATILAGDAETGVTLIVMDAGLDTGPIVAVEPWPLRGDETAPELERRAAEVGAGLVSRTIGPWLRGEVIPRAQPVEGTTFTRTLRRSDGRLEPSRPAAELERQVRAYQPWPGSFLEAVGGRIIVWRAHVEPYAATATATAAPIGAIEGGGDLRLGTAEGWLTLDEVQPAGGRRMDGPELLRGRPKVAGSHVTGE
jgi:methionyl-tRNA formyltransferase